MLLTLNELSINNTVDSEYNAKQLIEQFVLFCRNLHLKSIVDEIILPDYLFSLKLCDEYGLSHWLDDCTVRKENKQLFKRILDRYCRYYNAQDVNGEFGILVDGKECSSVGCAFAWEHSHTLMSFPTNILWENSIVSGNYSSLDEAGEIQTSTKCVDNVCTNMPFEELTSIHRKELSNSITSGQDLWEKREQLYPNLVFCENVKDQLFDDSEKYHIIAVMKKLNRFQEYFSNCGSSYDPGELGMDARTESETVKSDADLKNDRKFTLPDGNEKYFFDHVGFSGKYSGGRIYFIPDNLHNRCYIGYIGRHLRTKKY